MDLLVVTCAHLAYQGCSSCLTPPFPLSISKQELPLASVYRSGQADVVCQRIKAFRIQPKEMRREAAVGETGEVPLEAGDAPLALPLASTGGTFLLSPCRPALCRLPGLAKSKCPVIECNSSLTNAHPVCPHTSWLRAPQQCRLLLPVSVALFFVSWVPERLLQLWSVSLLSLLVFHVARWRLRGASVTQMQTAMH